MKFNSGYVFDELYSWYDSGPLNIEHVQPVEHWENVETKARIHSLVKVSGLHQELIHINARAASREELLRFHTKEYVDKVYCLSKCEEGSSGGMVGDEAFVGKGSYEIACRSAGGVLVAVEKVLSGEIDNCYCLVRPPGHHALSDQGMGFCIFNNIVLGCLHAKQVYHNLNVQTSEKRPCFVPEDNKSLRVAIIDIDVHHGNGTEAAFDKDEDVLFISIHQDNNYPIGKGGVVTNSDKKETMINVPLPPGSGSGAYKCAMERVVIPAIEKFKPQLILVSAGFDAAYLDPLSCMMLGSEDFRYMAAELMKMALKHCENKIIFVHEGGYSKQYTPFCALAVIETLVGESETYKSISDPFLEEVRDWGYQECQPHQAQLIEFVAKNHNLSALGADSICGESMLATKEESIQIAIFELLRSVTPQNRRLVLSNLCEMFK